MKRLKSVLTVDDDRGCNYVSKYLLTALKLTESVKILNNGEEAINYIKNISEFPELILLDIDMPVKNGFEFLEEYQKIDTDQKQECIIAVVSSSDLKTDFEKAKKLGAKDYICKPLTKEKLIGLYEKFFN